MRILSSICAFTVLLSCLAFSGVRADEPVGKMSSVYGYVLNDYIYTYGALHTDTAGDSITVRDEDYPPDGVIYGEIVNFDANENPYLVIFIADGGYSTASCHVWKYDEELEKADRIAILDINYTQLPDGQIGVFSLGASDEKRYITYKVYENDRLIRGDYYTVIDGDAFEYVNAPQVLSEIAVVEFSNNRLRPDVDVSRFNKPLDEFFDELKNAAADSVSFEDIAERLSDGDEQQLEAALKDAVSFEDFDIANYTAIEDYRAALDIEPNGDRFYLISEAYNLGDEIYYIRFSTDRSYYNYALLRRSDDADNGYQILKVRTDCIPLSDIELRQIKTDYSRNTLLYKASKGSLKLEKARKDADGEIQSADKSAKTDKTLSNRIRLPAVCLGGGIAIALLTLLWVYLYGDSD